MEMSGSVVSRRVSERWLAHALFEVGEALAVLHVLAGEDSAPVPQSWKAGLTISLRARAGRADLFPWRRGPPHRGPALDLATSAISLLMEQSRHLT